MSSARICNVPNFKITTLSLTPTPNQVTLSHGDKTLSYFTDDTDSKYLPTFPFIIKGDGEPFYEANMVLLDKADNTAVVSVESIRKFAGDLLGYQRFLEERNLSLFDFPRRKIERPTYLYSIELQHQVREGMSADSANRKIGSVVNFYRALKRLNLIPDGELKNKPFEEFEKTISYTTDIGLHKHKQVITTDLRIKGGKKAVDPDYIMDGGKVKPITPAHQLLLLEDLKRNASPEFRLISLLSLHTSARVQSACTFRLGTIDIDDSGHQATDKVTIACAGSSGIATKYDKRLVLKLPVWLLRKLKVYAQSPRYIARRDMSHFGDSDWNYLFLTKQGKPYYIAKYDEEALLQFSPIKNPRAADGVRQQWAALRERIQRIDPTFDHQFHDLRATFGMNLLDKLLYANSQIADPAKRMSDTAILNHIMHSMGHSNIKTTMQYLNYRRFVEANNVAQSDWESKLMELSQ